jgi:putative transposase
MVVVFDRPFLFPLPTTIALVFALCNMCPGTQQQRKEVRLGTIIEWHGSGRLETVANATGSTQRYFFKMKTNKRKRSAAESPPTVQDASGNDKVLEPFYNDDCKGGSLLLRSLATTALSSSYPLIKELGPSTVMTTNTGREETNSSVSFEISTASAKKFLATGSLPASGLTRIRRVQVFPTREQETMLNEWFGACRSTYNDCVALLNRVGCIPTKKGWFQWLRNRFVTNKNIQGRKVWLRNTPKHTREGAIKDFVTALKAAHTNKKNKNIKKFRMGFRKKSDNEQSILIQKGASGLRVDAQGVHAYTTYLHGPLETRQSLDDVSVNHDCRLLKSNGKFYLAIPIDVAPEEQVTTLENYCSIDPGVRTFASVWSPDGVSEIGDGLATELYPRLLALDKLRSDIDTEKRRRNRKRKQAAFERLSARFQSILKDFHYKAAHYLCSTYDNIVIPKFGSKGMSQRDGRRLRTKTVRHMLCLGHAKFRTILIQTAERMGKNVFVVSEEYTSKTCCNCGALHQKLGGSKRFRCAECGFQADRDIHGAFNIFLKFLKETSASICF